MDIWYQIDVSEWSKERISEGLHEFFNSHKPLEIDFNPLIIIFESEYDMKTKIAFMKLVMGYPEFAFKASPDLSNGYDFGSWAVYKMGHDALYIFEEIGWPLDSIDSNGNTFFHNINTLELEQQCIDVILAKKPALLSIKNVVGHNAVEYHLLHENVDTIDKLINAGVNISDFIVNIDARTIPQSMKRRLKQRNIPAVSSLGNEGKLQ